MDGDDDGRKFVSAMARGLDVLMAFGRHDRWLSNLELHERTGLPKSTLTRITYTLVTARFLHTDDSGQRFGLGPAVLHLATQLSDWQVLRQILRPRLAALAEVTGAAVGAAYLIRTELEYLEYCRERSSVVLALEVGSRIPVLGSAAGKAILTLMRDDEIQALAADGPDAPPADALEAQRQAAVQEMAERGFCASFGDWRPEINAIAVPLAIPAAAVNVAITVAGPSMLLSSERLANEVAPLLLSGLPELNKLVRGLI